MNWIVILSRLTKQQIAQIFIQFIPLRLPKYHLTWCRLLKSTRFRWLIYLPTLQPIITIMTHIILLKKHSIIKLFRLIHHFHFMIFCRQDIQPKFIMFVLLIHFIFFVLLDFLNVLLSGVFTNSLEKLLLCLLLLLALKFKGLLLLLLLFGSLLLLY
jgi:hypothetical protein